MKKEKADYQLTNEVPRPESDRQYIFGMILLLANRFQAKLDSYTGEITLKQWLLLCMLNIMKTDAVSVNDLAKVAGYSRQNAKKLVDILVKKGYLELKPSSIDKRSYEVRLTDKAMTFFAAFEEKGNQIIERLFNGIDEKRLTATSRALETVLNNIEKM